MGVESFNPSYPPNGDMLPATNQLHKRHDGVRSLNCLATLSSTASSFLQPTESFKDRIKKSALKKKNLFLQSYISVKV